MSLPIKRAVALIMLSLCPSALFANDWITAKLTTKPERILKSRHAFYDVERCVVYSSVRGWVYRTPDRPKETLWIDAGRGSSRHILWRLYEPSVGIVQLDVLEGNDNLNDDTRSCFESGEIKPE